MASDASFFAEDQGDGWWDCSSPLACTIIDGPSVCPQFSDDESTYWLVSTDPAIVYNGDSQYAERWGDDHPLCHPIEPTRLAMVMAGSRYGPVDPGRDFGVPMYPVLNDAKSLSEAKPSAGLGAKVSIHQSLPD